MPTDNRPILIDSNVLIYASSPASPFHAAALTALERLEESGGPAWISAQIVREYLVHMTRHDVLGERTISNVVDQIERLCGHFQVASDSDQVERSFWDSCGGTTCKENRFMMRTLSRLALRWACRGS